MYFLLSDKELDFARAGEVNISGKSLLPKPINLKLPIFVDINNKNIINTIDYMIGIVNGESAIPVGLNNGDFYLAKPASNNKDEIEVGDILLLKISEKFTNKASDNTLNDIGRLKIRVVSEINRDSKKLHTITFTNGRPRLSRPHDFSDVIGIIKYKIPPSDVFFENYIKPVLSHSESNLLQ